LDVATTLLATDQGDDAGRTGQLYERLYGRPPTPSEVARTGAFRDQFAKGLAADEPDTSPSECNLRAWQALCQTLLASNEFVYLD
ncbi:MAG: hypothetical protein ABI353_13480, partial [Isosphaeraceae bacterium]